MIIENEIKEITALFEHSKTINTEVSQVSVGWHLEHVLISICKVCKAMELSDPSSYQWKFNKIRAYLYLKGSIPRGRARAPKSVVLDSSLTDEEQKALLAKAIQKLQILESLHKNAHFEHPYFGDLNVKGSKWFVKLHTIHHLKIVREILRS